MMFIYFFGDRSKDTRAHTHTHTLFFGCIYNSTLSYLIMNGP